MNRLPEALFEGHTEPLGSHVRNGGVNFAVFSQHAEKMELCIFDASGVREIKRYALFGPSDGVWHGWLPDVGEGLVYGLRAHGAYAPEQGHRFNAHKLLLDPYARDIVGHFTWRAEHHGYELGHPEGARSFDARDNGINALKARVANPLPALARQAPRHAASNVVLYEVHVKGFSMTHPGIPEALRGTYAALAHPAAVAHFRKLGVTTLSLLPVQYCVSEPGLAERGMPNYWGYNTLGFNCPDPRLSYANRNGHDPATVRHEFREMVETLHVNGLEVVLDVVYNHTPEGNEFGPTLSFRGLDNASYYRLVRDDKSRSENLTGCGNTLNVEHPRVTQFVLDSLRYWVTEMGVDGFRFDLAPVLGRRQHGFDVNAAFFVALRQDPVLAQVHLIAEPWDAGFDGYQVGRFPGRFLEWNDKFRDAVRGYWLGTGSVGRGELARRFTGSSDVFHHAQRRPAASINYICVHDGFTLADVTSYSQKHNLANGEDNRDGRDGELCANFGAEGPSNDPQIVDTRRRVRRAMLATLLLAQGTPMLCAGDEMGNSQSGNNNAYCQDNELTWLNWDSADQGLTDLVAELLALRREESLLRHNDWFHASGDTTGASIVWVAANGHEMHAHDWHDNGTLAFACLLRAETDFEQAENKARATGAGRTTSAQLLIAFNPEARDNILHLPERPEVTWQVVFDSTGTSSAAAVYKQHAPLTLPARSVLVLRVLASALQASAWQASTLPPAIRH